MGEFIEKLYVRHFAELGVKPNVEQENAEDEKKFYFWSETWVDPILEFLICGNESQKSSVIEVRKLCNVQSFRYMLKPI